MAIKNVGKKFEQDIENSLKNSKDKNIYYKRYRDVIGVGNKSGLAGSDSVSDYGVYSYPNLFLLELKTTKSTSFNLSKTYLKNKYKLFVFDSNNNKIIKHYGMISVKQIDKMEVESICKGVHGYYLIEMRKYNEVYVVSHEDILGYIDDAKIARKSLTVDFLKVSGKIVPRTIKTTAWLTKEQQILLDSKELDNKDEVLSIFYKVFPNTKRKSNAIWYKFRQIKKIGSIKPFDGYIHYNYDIEKLIEIIVDLEKLK